MDFETFLLERNQSLYENNVEINLTESGVHAGSLRDLLTPDEIDAVLNVTLGYGHTEGLPALRQAVAAWHPGATAENVLITTGASEANLVAMLSVLGPSDEAIVLVPNFMQIPGAARAIGAKVHTVPLDAERGWRLDHGALKAALSPRTRLIGYCNPNNPTGIILPKEDIEFLIAASEEADSWLLADEIYRGAELHERGQMPTLWGKTPRALVTGGLAKSFAHPGLRIGWIVAPPDFISECMRRQDYTTIGTSTLCQHIATRLLAPERRDALLESGRATLKANLAIVQDFVKRRDDLTLTPPDAGGMAFVRYRHAISSEELSRRLRETESVFVVAGAWFGLDGAVRIGIGGDADVLREGLRRFGAFLDRLNESPRG